MIFLLGLFLAALFAVVLDLVLQLLNDCFVHVPQLVDLVFGQVLREQVLGPADHLVHDLLLLLGL